MRRVNRQRAGDDEHAPGPTENGCFRHGVTNGGPTDPDHLDGRPGRIAQRADEIEDRRPAEGPAQRANAGHRRMVGGGKAEGEAEVGEAGGREGRGSIDANPEPLEDVGRAGAARDGPVAMLCHRQTGPRHDDRRGGGDVERARPVATGAAGVGDDRQGMRHTHHPAAEGRGDAGDFGGRLPGLGEGHEPRPEGVEVDISREHSGDERLDVGRGRMAAAAEKVDLPCQRERGR